MPMLIDTVTRTGALVSAVNELLAEGGPRALSVRAIGRVSHVSPSSIIHHFGTVEQLLRVAAHWTGGARREAIAVRANEGALAFLPATDDDVVDARVWLAWCELWRSDPAVEVVIREAREDERALLARLTDYAHPADELDVLVALIEGLTVACCAPHNPHHPSGHADSSGAGTPRDEWGA
ncbi:helix-turn-helix domain-containing protein [Nocardioides sp.]|uniref:helix-turn-helix domain-containing protein n=1 Tax=Nocardioides sp. TaxID=35761 RepID=UPI002ED23266